MINLTRQQWRELSRKTGKDWKVLKDTVCDVEREAFHKGVDVGIDSTKNAVLNIVHTTLHKDFGFGPKRMGQFNEAFRTNLSMVQVPVVEEEKNVQQLILTESDKERVMVLVAMTQFIEATLSSSSLFAKDGELKDYIQGANIEINNAISMVKSSISEDVLSKIVEDLQNTCLYIAPKNI